MKRTNQIDFFRGILLILITIDHILAEKDVIKYFTYEFVGWVTAAEGFVFLSGLTAGIVYTRRRAEKGEAFVNETVKARAFLIYRNHIAVLVFALVAVLFGYGINAYWVNNYSLFYNNPLLAVFLGAILLYQPAYLDVLPMYAIFILFVPVIIKYFTKGYVWQVFVLSIMVYLSSFFKGFDFLKDVPQISDINIGFFNILSWQLIFCIGLFSGFSFYHGRSAKWVKNKFLLLLALIVCLGFFVLKNIHVNVEELEYLFSRNTLGLLRIINCLSIIFILSFVSSIKSAWFTFKPVCYLGRYSLEVFSFHVILLIVFKPLINVVSNAYSYQITQHFFIYPLALLLILCLIVPALFLAPTLLRKKTYVLTRSEINPLPSEAWLTSAAISAEDYEQAV